MPGSVSQVVGAVVDCTFDTEKELPPIYSALKVAIGEKELTLEVQQHLEGTNVRAVAMGSTDGLKLFDKSHRPIINSASLRTIRGALMFDR